MQQYLTHMMMPNAPRLLKWLFHSYSSTTIPTTTTNNMMMMMKLSDQQQQVLNAISNGQSVFITGSAGTGKTLLLLQAIQLLKQIHNPNRVFVTASTGVAACALNGQTLHSFAGIGLGLGNQELLLRRVGSNKQSAERWRSVAALVIDEVSMISGELFDKLEHIAKKIRRSRPPWGGIQLIVSGDFFQLPPILKSHSHSNSSLPVNVKEFAFEAKCWSSSFDLQVELTRVFRQSDAQFVNLLQRVRRGVRDGNVLQILRNCNSKPMNYSNLEVPRLYPRNEDVRRVNAEKLGGLGGEIVEYRAVDTGKEPWMRQLRQGIAPNELQICLGARVMLIKNKNVEVGLVNGAVGTVTGFVETEKVRCPGVSSTGLLPRVKFDCGAEMVMEVERWDVMEGELVVATRRQVPLILSWALSVHKCQGMTLDVLHTDLSRAFGCGMVYVALSRVRTLEGLHLSGFDASKIAANPKVLEFYQNTIS
ncbi:hypothetical protein Syun_005086 [Stephania yunnanensis]|uniref:ATP-dependent DNA helicase n=1 Tax=Stephania yunnanensis TaxID=152371 RepID=A0AAP0Q348_9MAGN